jgi:hypothetical protein
MIILRSGQDLGGFYGPAPFARKMAMNGNLLDLMIK